MLLDSKINVLCLDLQEEEDRRRQRVEDWERHQEGKGYRSKRYKSPVNSLMFRTCSYI